MRRVIITGGSGFVGANLTRRLLKDGHEVHLLVRPGYATWRIESIRPHVHLHEVDLGDEKSLSPVICRIRPDWVFHLATHGAYPSQNNTRRIVQTNIIGTLNLLEACLAAGFAAFVNTGSSSEYGFKDHAALENDWLEPNSDYAVAKASSTLLCRHVAQKHGVHLPTLRLYSVYGPYEEPSRLMPMVLAHGAHGKLPPLANPNIARDYVYVDDVSEAYLLAAMQPGQESGAIYNVGTGTQTSLREVVEVARRVMNIQTEPLWGSMPDRRWDTNVWVADNNKINQALGWQPRLSFEEGFRKMLRWFEENPGLRNLYQ